jgi:3-deoxy-D-manno-octulosonic-acid transferase
VRLARWGVDAIYGASIAGLPLYALTRLATDQKTRARWGAYLWGIPARFGRRRPRVGQRPCVWVHGVSVGEVKAATQLVEEIEARVPGVEIIISATTDTGNRVARRQYPRHRVEFYPPDLSWIVDDALAALRPDLVVLVESEFWPNFLFSAHAWGIPVAVVNGRMSARSARRFHALRRFTEPLLSTLEQICVQLPVYAERFRSMGLDPDRIHVTGNMKFDNIPLRPDPIRRAQFERMLGTQSPRPTLVAGSTHPGEERAMASIARRLKDAGHPLRLILAPRHPGRADTVENDIRRFDLSVVRRSRLGPEGPPPQEDVILLDTVGELEVVYGLADMVFTGGSLVPHGGHNVMEPASLGKPVVVGPHFHNFRGEVDMLLANDGIAIASNAADTEAILRGWIQDPDSGRSLGERARRVIAESKGATGRTLEILAPQLDRLRKASPRASEPRARPR